MSGVAGTEPGSLHRRLSLFLQALLGLGFLLAVLDGLWLDAVLTASILLLTLLPFLIGRRFAVFIPPEIELLAIVFIFASLFLGELRGYYARFPWWDKVLHTGSGFLLGVLGFLLVYVLNQHERVDLHMKPGFVALFAFVFAVAIGAIWEIFEFTMDVLFGLAMQKDSLVDTMWDLIVDCLGAASIAGLGHAYMRSKTDSFLERWIRAFVRANPRLFGRSEG